MLKNEPVLAIDIGASAITFGRFAVLGTGGLELVDFGRQSLGLEGSADEDRGAHITSALRTLILERGLRPGPALLSVSGQSVFVRFVKLPPVDREKIQQIVQYEAQQNVPFPINEVIWDYQLIGGREGEIDVMLAAIKKDVVEHICDAVAEAGIEPELVDVAPLALYNAFRFNYTETAGCTLLVDMGARSTDLVFVEQGRVFSRSIPVGGNTITQQLAREFDQDFADAEELKKAHAFVSFGGAYDTASSEVAEKVSKSVRSVMTRLHAEISRSINFYRTQQAGSKPGLLLLTGGSSVIPYTDTFLKEKVGAEVDFLNPFQNVAVSSGIESEAIGSHIHFLGEVVGLALRRTLTCPIEINLLPPKLKAEKELQRKQPAFLVAAFGLVLVLTVWAGYFLRLSQLASSRLDDVSGRLAQLRMQESELQAVENQMALVESKFQAVRDLMEGRSRWPTVLQAIYADLPSGMWVISLEPKPHEEEQDGLAPDMGPRPMGPETPVAENVGLFELHILAHIDEHPEPRSIREFRDRLRESDLFDQEATDIIWSPTPDEDATVREFRLRAVLKEPLSA